MVIRQDRRGIVEGRQIDREFRRVFGFLIEDLCTATAAELADAPGRGSVVDRLAVGVGEPVERHRSPGEGRCAGRSLTQAAMAIACLQRWGAYSVSYGDAEAADGEKQNPR